MIDIPLGLRQSLEGGDCIIFIGAGIGHYVRDKDGREAPDGRELSEELKAAFGIVAPDINDLAKISQIVEIRNGRTELETFVKNRLSNLEPDENFMWIPTMTWRAIYTTNYDRAIQRSYDLTAKPPQAYFTVASTADLKDYDPRFQVPIFHLHGSLFSAAKAQIVITEKDYTKYKERRRMMFEQLKLHLATCPILYLGYSNADPNWKIVLTEIEDEFYPSEMPRSYRIDPHASEIDTEILKNRNLETLKCDFEEFVASSKIAIDMSFDKTKMQTYIESVPTSLHSAFEKNPAATLRLLSAWGYVNQAPFNETPNTKDFLRGDKPNWALISGKQHFERDIEEEAYESLIDFATSMSDKPQISLILGSAGYGTSTLLMTLATRLVKDRAGAAFFLKPGREIREGDVEFALSIFDEQKVFFFVDNAAEYSDILGDIQHKYRDANRAVMFVLGERTNEWKQSNTKTKASVFPILALSDGEIYRLLECLGKHRELNKLEDLSQDLQFAAIKKNYNRELLVTIREATEGKSFDAIIEDEFRGIKGDKSRFLYLAVCCFYQHGAYARDNLLASILGCNIAELYKDTEAGTEGVVIYDCIDDSKGTYGARARHRIIAAIVWDRCGESGMKEKLVQDALAALNLNYRIDKQALELFTRSDRLVDGLQTLDQKIRFFETACNKDPDSPYIRQHFARMLLRENKENLALNEIQKAIEMSPDVRVLYHTKGRILSHMALNAESIEVGRRRLYQAEASFRQGLRMNPKDDYCYQGLAQLFLGWAKIVSDEKEQIEYVNKAEGIINDGLKLVKQRESLWIESANVQEYLGNQPSKLMALERAIKDHPSGIIARYLLARAYRQQGKFDKTLETLEPVVRDYPEEFRLMIEYARALLCLGKPYKDCIAILNLSTLYGYSDPGFIATLGGLYFMDKQFTEAERVFAESRRRDFSGIELYRAFFRPPDPSDTSKGLRLIGTVKVVKAGFSMIETSEYPPFLCPGSKYGNILMSEGLKISFGPAFTPKGNIAEKPQKL